MFSKLLKYEWKANANVISFLSLASLGAGVFGGLLLRLMIYIAETMRNGEILALSMIGLVIMFIFTILAIIAYVMAVEFITLARFYKNKFTDEGYLTFTLPVSTHQIFLSSFLNILIWYLISLVVAILSCSLIVMIGAAEHMTKVLPEIQLSLGYLGMEMESYPGYGLYQLLTVLQLLLTPVYGVILLMSCITVGSVLAKKHKILAAIGIYYGASVVFSIITSILSAIPSILLMFSNEDITQNLYVNMNISTCIVLGLQIAVAVGGYFLSTGLMKRKLNLP